MRLTVEEKDMLVNTFAPTNVLTVTTLRDLPIILAEANVEWPGVDQTAMVAKIAAASDAELSDLAQELLRDSENA